MSRCAAEMCPNWTGDGCACRVFGIEPPRDCGLDCEERGRDCDCADAQPAVCGCGSTTWHFDRPCTPASGDSAVTE